MNTNSFGTRRIYYNNFAEHLQNAYNPNMLYPDLPNRWPDRDWFRLVDMLAFFGFNVIEYWLVPRLFSRRGLDSDYGREFARQINAVTDYAHQRGIKIEFICALATTGDEWHTLCPNLADEWDEIRYLWDQWTSRLPGTDIVGIFPGDPGACSRHGCTAETYIDRACEIAALAQRNLPDAEIEFHTWGPPFFGWGNLKGPPDWRGEFVQAWQHTAWEFDKTRSDRAMRHLLKRLPDFPQNSSVAINLGFNPDGRPEGDQDARPWAREIAAIRPIQTWDFSLTEGENNVVPHYRFARLFEQRRRERESAPYRGGICYTMTPRLNQLSLWQAAQSFIDPDADPDTLTADFYEKLFGHDGRKLVPLLPLFEVVKDWGCYLDIDPFDPGYHRRMTTLRDLLVDLAASVNPDAVLFPDAESYRRELLFFAQWFVDISGPSPDYDTLAQQYWQRVYAIYDALPDHVDPRPHQAVKTLVDRFRKS